MNFTTNKMIQLYFNFAYNPVYDLTIGRLNRYQELQRRCINKLNLRDNDRILCVGLGTGNEVNHILQANKNVNIVGVDFSKNALKKAYKKALSYGKEIDVLPMDVRHLEFTAGSFDKVICLHVMDFVKEQGMVISDILRVLKNGGQFVITYPSGKEGVSLGLNLLKDNIRHHVDSGKNFVSIFFDILVQILAGIICLPMLLRPEKRFYSQRELEAIITALEVGDYLIEEDRLYNDFIIYGSK